MKSAVSTMSLAFALQALPPGEMKNQIALCMVANNKHMSVPLPTHLNQIHHMAPVMPHSKVASPLLVAHNSCQPSQTMELPVQLNSLPITCNMPQSLVAPFVFLPFSTGPESEPENGNLPEFRSQIPFWSSGPFF